MAFALKIGFLLLTAFLIKPTALGENYSILGIGTALLALLFHLIDCRVHPLKKITIQGPHRLVLFLVLLLFSYLLGHAMLMNSIFLVNVLKAALLNCIVVCIAAFILSEARANYIFFRSMVIIFIGFIVSYYVTIALAVFVAPLEQLELFRIQIGDYPSSGMTYLPFTVMYGVYTVDGIRFPRLLGLFRESGILQMFLIWALFNLKSIRLNRLWIKGTLLLGIIASFSTAGLAILFANLVLLLFMNKKVMRGVALLCFTYIVVMYAPFIGINDKTETHGASISDRTMATEAGLEALGNNPFGEGMYNTRIPNAGINLVAASSMIGVVGVLLTMLVYLAPALAAGNRKRYLLAVIPIILTSLLSQPLLDAPLLYLLLMAPYIGEEEPLPRRATLLVQPALEYIR